jgi:hypothetical protein
MNKLHLNCVEGLEGEGGFDGEGGVVAKSSESHITSAVGTGYDSDTTPEPIQERSFADLDACLSPATLPTAPTKEPTALPVCLLLLSVGPSKNESLG